MENKIVLQKGESINFLDYTIMNSRNNDGLILMKNNSHNPSLYNYEHHLGNYGEGTQENLDFCKKNAILFFMIARPQIFAHCITNKINRSGGCWGEYLTFRSVLEIENIEMPSEITCGDGINAMIYFNNKPLN